MKVPPPKLDRSPSKGEQPIFEQLPIGVQIAVCTAAAREIDAVLCRAVHYFALHGALWEDFEMTVDAAMENLCRKVGRPPPHLCRRKKGEQVAACHPYTDPNSATEFKS